MAVQPRPGSRLDFSHPLAQGVVGWWEMNMGSGLVVPDLSAAQNDGTMKDMDAETDWTAGTDGYALDFDGSNDYVAIAGAASTWNFATDYTVMARFNPRGWGHGGYGRILACGQNEGWMMYVRQPSTTCVFNHLGKSNVSIGPIALGNTYTAAAVVDASGNGTPYLDGVAGTPGSMGGYTNAVDPLLMGSRKATDRWFDGQIEQVTIYDRALSADEVAWLYAEPHAPIWTPNPVSYFSRATAYYQTLTETLALTDTRNSGVGREVTDDLGLTDTRNSGVGREVTDDLGLTDSRTASVTRELTESLGLLDTALKSPSRTVAETLGLVETIEREISRRLAETLGMDDARSVEVARALVDTLGVDGIDPVEVLDVVPPLSVADIARITLLVQDVERIELNVD